MFLLLPSHPPLSIQRRCRSSSFLHLRRRPLVSPVRSKTPLFQLSILLPRRDGICPSMSFVDLDQVADGFSCSPLRWMSPWPLRLCLVTCPMVVCPKRLVSTTRERWFELTALPSAALRTGLVQTLATFGISSTAFCSSSDYHIIWLVLALSSVLDSRGRTHPEVVSLLSGCNHIVSCGDSLRRLKSLSASSDSPRGWSGVSSTVYHPPAASHIPSPQVPFRSPELKAFFFLLVAVSVGGTGAIARVVPSGYTLQDVSLNLSFPNPVTTTLLPSVGTLIAFGSKPFAVRRFLTAFCSPSLIASPLFQGLVLIIFVSPVNGVLLDIHCPPFSFVEFVCLLFPPALCGFDVGSDLLKSAVALALARFKGSTTWCVFISAFVTI